ncbi:MAG: DUF1080 domain-containing protein [Clostridia bacterium]|nr:DUF1080 domain-containing protein [Clostridia bacterium]
MKEKVILFDGTNLDGFYTWDDERPDEKTPAAWELKDGVMTVTHGHLVSKYEYGDAQIHVEFRIPDQPDREGQWKGNSGVYVHGCYEIQVLDSWGNEPKLDECGAIYGIAAPLTIASLEPEKWQTYDIVIRAAKLNGDGSIKVPAVITVLHNGVVIHNNLTLPRNNPGGVTNYVVERGPLLLQDHACPVSYRNIWVQPLD